MSFSSRRRKVHSRCTNRSPPLRIRSQSFLSTRSIQRRASLTSVTSWRNEARISGTRANGTTISLRLSFLVVFYYFANLVQVRRGAVRVIFAQILAQCGDLDIAASTEEIQVSARIATKKRVERVPRVPSVAFVRYLFVQLERNR